MKKGLMVVLLLLGNVSSLVCNRKGRSPAERRVKTRLIRDKVERAVEDGDVNQFRMLIKEAKYHTVYNYFRKIDPRGRRALSLARDLDMKRELVAWGAGETKSGFHKVKSCPNIARLCIGAVSPRGRDDRELSASPRSCAAEVAALSPRAVDNLVDVAA